MDDISPLRELGPAALSLQAEATLLKPRAAFRFKERQRVDTPPNDQSRPEPAPYGAVINYYLKSVPAGGLAIEIYDESGAKIRTLRGTANKGLNRVVWNLRHEPLRQIELRTTPSFHPHVWEEKRFRGRTTRPVLHWGIQPPQAGVLAAPGTYTVKLAVDGKESSQTLEVRKDPSSRGTVEDIRDMVRLWAAVVQDINEVVGMINRLEWVGKQMEDLAKTLEKTKDGAALRAALSETQAKLMAVEDKLLQRQLHASDPKSYRAEMMLYSKLLWFSGEIGTGAGDIRNTEDFGPTSQQLEVYGILKKRLAEARGEYDKLIREVIPAFSRTMEAAGRGALVTDIR
jgi:hypothetical protein